VSRIKILPEILSNKIAAGEVVERPASVVKELLENSLDAGSRRIIVEIEKGGRSLIRVSDNGIGMNHDDALLSIERYATSKIYQEPDLYSIKTLGFRGEALPSIASVSCFTLESKDEISPVGTRIEVEGGKIKDVSQVGAPVGTLITVKQIFFNTPARRKFLKSINTEMGHIADTVANIALGWHNVQFRLCHNEKVIKTWTSCNDPVHRVKEILGNDVKNELNKIEYDNSFISLSGWIASPNISRYTSKGIYIYVNGRFVKDRIIQHAIFEGYSGRLVKGQFPLAVLFINVPPDQVDVNVHPAKNEVRFAHQNKIHEAVSESVSESLYKRDLFVSFSSNSPQPEQDEIFVQNDDDTADYIVSEPAASFNQINKKELLQVEKKDVNTIITNQSDLWEKKSWGDIRIIGQFHGTYILCESSADGLLMIDQHAAHERILFEHLKNQNAADHNIQKLLISEIIDLRYREAEIVEKLIPNFKEIGLEIEPFGGNTFAVKAVPAIFGNREIKPLVTDIAEKILEITRGDETDTGAEHLINRVIDESLMLIACHSAVKANQNLSEDEIKMLLEQLSQCESPSFCPHGRPTWIQLSKSFIEKSFHRTG